MKQTTVLTDTDKSFATLAHILSSKTIELTPEVAFRCLDMIEKVIDAHSASSETLHAIKILAKGDEKEEVKLLNEYTLDELHVAKNDLEALRLSAHALFDKIENDGKHKISKVVADLDLLTTPSQSDMFDQDVNLVTGTDGTKKRADNKTIKVLFNGSPIEGSFQKTIFVKALKKMALNKIANSSYRFRNKKLVSRNKKERESYTMEQIDTTAYWTIMPTNSWEKVQVLNELAVVLGCNIVASVND